MIIAAVSIPHSVVNFDGLLIPKYMSWWIPVWKIFWCQCKQVVEHRTNP